MDYVWLYGNKFGLRLQYHLPNLGLAIHQQPPRLVTSQGTQAQLVGAGIAIPVCWAVGIVAQYLALTGAILGVGISRRKGALD